MSLHLMEALATNSVKRALESLKPHLLGYGQMEAFVTNLCR